MKKLFLCCLLLTFFGKVQTEELENSTHPLLVSLGSHCEVTMHISHNKMRTAAFPFDWLLTLDYQGFISALKDDFYFFMDKSYLYQHPEGNIIHTKYNIDFRHDWPDMNFEKHFPEIRKKYERRIRRFQQLNEYAGRVYFMRSPFDLSINPRLPTITKECTKIDTSHAQALRDVLRQKFPHLDFRLIIINYAEEHTPSITGIEQVMEFKVRKSHKKEDYSAIIQQLLKSHSM